MFHSKKLSIYSQMTIDLKNYPFLKSVKNENQANVKIFSSPNNKFIININNNKELLPMEKLPVFLDHLNQTINSRQITNLRKKEAFQNLKFPAKRKIINNFVKNFSTTYQDIIKELIKSEKLDDIPKKLSKLDDLKSYSSFIMLTQHKGRSNASVSDFENKKQKTYYLSSSSFNSIFKAIKKSKSNAFLNQKAISEELRIVGNFLGHAISLNKLSIILIVSRNDLIAPSLKEMNIFSDFVNQLDMAFSYIENKNSLLLDTKIFLEIFKKIGYSMEIETPEEETLTNTQDQTYFSQTYSPPWSFLILKYSAEENSFLSPDIFHYHRIRLLGELFNILKHELSNPILGINMVLDILRNDEAFKESKELLDEVKLASSRAQNILNNMTNLFIKDQDKREIYVKDILDTLTAILKSELRLIKYSFDISEEHQNIKLDTNISSIIQILFNLIYNAIHELKNKKESKNLYLKTQADKSFFSFIIEDTASGLPLNIKENLFKPFYTNKESGNGLGLSLSKNLALKNGGDLVLEKSDSSGTIFKLLIPLNNEENSCH